MRSWPFCKRIEIVKNTLFKQVTLVEGKTYPYQTMHYSGIAPHFILQGPKYPQMTYSKLKQDALTKKGKL